MEQDRLRQLWREASARKYAADPVAARIKNKATRARAVARNKEYVNRIRSGPCSDCGGKFPVVAMQFDHQGDKTGNISDMVRRGRPLQMIINEIAKCELVCSNCHAVRTWGNIAE